MREAHVMYACCHSKSNSKERPLSVGGLGLGFCMFVVGGGMPLSVVGVSSYSLRQLTKACLHQRTLLFNLQY